MVWPGGAGIEPGWRLLLHKGAPQAAGALEPLETSWFARSEKKIEQAPPRRPVAKAGAAHKSEKSMEQLVDQVMGLQREPFVSSYTPPTEEEKQATQERQARQKRWARRRWIMRELFLRYLGAIVIVGAGFYFGGVGGIFLGGFWGLVWLFAWGMNSGGSWKGDSADSPGSYGTYMSDYYDGGGSGGGG